MMDCRPRLLSRMPVTRSSTVSNWPALLGAEPSAELMGIDAAEPDVPGASSPVRSVTGAADTPEAAAARVARVERIFHRHLNAVWRTARDLGVLPRDLEDVVQEVMIVCVRRLHDIEPQRERAFLLAATAKVVANWRRGRRRRPAEPVQDVDAVDGVEPARAPGGPAEALEHKRELELVQAALDQMTEPQRVAFTLFEIEGLTAREIADQLGLSESVVFARVQRARGVPALHRQGRRGAQRPGRPPWLIEAG
jgi:RNA polymerase sigma-70 factor (ECF subfamily)